MKKTFTFKPKKYIVKIEYESDPIEAEDSDDAINKFFEEVDIFKKNYKIKYYVSCELEKTESELKNNKYPINSLN